MSKYHDLVDARRTAYETLWAAFVTYANLANQEADAGLAIAPDYAERADLVDAIYRSDNGIVNLDQELIRLQLWIEERT